MPNGRRWNISYPRKFTAGAIIAIGLFVTSAGVGLLEWSVIAVGIALNALAVSLLVISAIRADARSFVRGTAHVLEVTAPPGSTEFAWCELHVVVQAQGLNGVKVKIHDERAPVAKWPGVGDTLPVRVAVEDPHHVRILWGEIPTHAERAAEEERFHLHVQRIVAAELASEGEPADESTSSADDTAAVPRPRPRPRRPSPRPVRDGGENAAATSASAAREPSASASGQREAEASAPARDGDEDEVPVHDAMPIEGASAVLGRTDGPRPPVGTAPRGTRPSRPSQRAHSADENTAEHPITADERRVSEESAPD